MREIKFRGKRKDSGQWVFGGYHQWITRQICPIGDDNLEPEDIKDVIIIDSFADWNMPRSMQAIEIFPETLGQYIGKDLAGREIYEGDIIKGFFNNSSAEKSIGRIEYDNCCFVVTLEFEYGQLWRTRFDIENCEFLGNIHDNPELLKEVKE